MFKKIRDWFRGLTAKPDSRIFSMIEVVKHDGLTVTQVFDVEAIGTQGLALWCNRLDGTGAYLLRSYSADQARFWRVWRAVGGKDVALTWEEDGAPFNPGV